MDDVRPAGVSGQLILGGGGSAGIDLLTGQLSDGGVWTAGGDRFALT